MGGILSQNIQKVCIVDGEGNPSAVGGVQADPDTVGGSSAATERVSTGAAYEAFHIVKYGPGKLLSLFGYNSGAGGFIQLFDATEVPDDGEVPVSLFAVPGTANFSLDLPVLGSPFFVGICVVFSSTAPQKTLSTESLFLTAITK